MMGSVALERCMHLIGLLLVGLVRVLLLELGCMAATSHTNQIPSHSTLVGAPRRRRAVSDNRFRLFLQTPFTDPAQPLPPPYPMIRKTHGPCLNPSTLPHKQSREETAQPTSETGTVEGAGRTQVLAVPYARQIAVAAAVGMVTHTCCSDSRWAYYCTPWLMRSSYEPP